jgi:radical SAM superfamily enzyme YgiQ (UPF0313 family)
MLRFSLLSLTTVAALTPREHEVEICDENVETLDFDAPVDVVGVSFMTAFANRAYEIADEFRGRGKVVVAGGFHPTLCPDEAAEHFDAVVAGDAEGLWPRVLEDIEAGRLQRIYRHVELPDPALIPVPRRDLVNRTARHYATTNAVQTSRGCAHGCRFCSVTAFHRRTHRTRPLENVLAELRSLPRNVMFVDDNIIGDRECAKALFRAMTPMKKRWISQCSIEIADDPELLALARRAGCRGLFIGIETLSERNLAAVGKEFNDAARLVERVAKIRRAGIGVQAGIIVGMDGDDAGVFERTLAFLEHARIDALQLGILTPLPGTPLFEEFQRQGRLIDADWSHYDFRHAVIHPAGMTTLQLQAGADWLDREFYRLDRILLRTLRALFTLGPLCAALVWRLNGTYRYDNLREGIVGRNPARAPGKTLRDRAVAFLCSAGERFVALKLRKQRPTA